MTLGPLEEQPALLTDEPSLQPLPILLEGSPFVLTTHILLTGSVTKKAATEDTKPEPEVPGRAECSQSPPLDPGTQVEKKTLHVSLGSQVSKEAEKRPKAEKVMEESQGASQPKPSTPQESLGAGTEPLILHEMVRRTLPLPTTNGTKKKQKPKKQKNKKTKVSARET